MARNGCNCYFSFWAIFCLSTSLTAQKIKTKKKRKQTPGDIIILQQCTKNHDHMLCCSWDMVCDGCNYFSYWVIFCTYTALTAKKSKFKRKWKNVWRYHFTYVYQKLRTDHERFLRYGEQRMDGRMEKVTYRGGCPTCNCLLSKCLLVWFD